MEALPPQAEVKFKRGIENDGIHALPVNVGGERGAYIPNFLLLDHPRIIIECADLSIRKTFKEWERTFRMLRTNGILVILVIPDSEQAKLAERHSDFYVIPKNVKLIPSYLKTISRALEYGMEIKPEEKK